MLKIKSDTQYEYVVLTVNQDDKIVLDGGTIILEHHRVIHEDDSLEGVFTLLVPSKLRM